MGKMCQFEVNGAGGIPVNVYAAKEGAVPVHCDSVVVVFF